MVRILVTGASTGLGLLTANTLAAQGHEVILHARNEQRLYNRDISKAMADTIFGDLSNLDETIGIAEQAENYGRFDAVVHNAGVINGDDLVPVNVVAPYVLTSLMTPPSRVIVLSSSMHLSGSPRHVSAGIAGHRRVSYSDSKLFVTAWTMGMAWRWPNVLFHAVCPGWVPTRMGGASAPDDLTEGHRTQEWLATAQESTITPRTGGYWHHMQPRAPHRAALNEEFQEQVIRALEARTGIVLPAAP